MFLQTALWSDQCELLASNTTTTIQQQCIPPPDNRTSHHHHTALTTPHKLPGFGQAGHSKPTAKDRTPRKEELSGKDRGRVFYKQKTLATHLTI